MWIYDKFEGKLKRENLSAEVMEPVLFDISKSHVFVSQAFGLVIWNNKSWAWTHPQCPFILRFEWDETRKVFKQFVPKVPPKDKPMAPALSDWQFVEGGIRSVVVGNRNPKPEVLLVLTSWKLNRFNRFLPSLSGRSKETFHLPSYFLLSISTTLFDVHILMIFH